MFAIVLFLVSFSFYCCLYNAMQHNYGINIAISPDKSNQVKKAGLTQRKPIQIEALQQPEPVDKAVQNPVLEAIEQLPIGEAQIDATPRTRVAESLVLEQITNLKLREARIVAKLLGITQKVNGKDKPLDWLQREIRQKLTSDRAVVISALQQLKAS